MPTRTVLPGWVRASQAAVRTVLARVLAQYPAWLALPPAEQEARLQAATDEAQADVTWPNPRLYRIHHRVLDMPPQRRLPRGFGDRWMDDRYVEVITDFELHAIDWCRALVRVTFEDGYQVDCGVVLPQLDLERWCARWAARHRLLPNVAPVALVQQVELDARVRLTGDAPNPLPAAGQQPATAPVLEPEQNGKAAAGQPHSKLRRSGAMTVDGRAAIDAYLTEHPDHGEVRVTRHLQSLNMHFSRDPARVAIKAWKDKHPPQAGSAG
jgi:hypothetical protein